VLPLANRSGLDEDEYFTDGIHDQILTQLSRISGLSVRGRTSVMQYRDSPKNLREIGQELNARYLLEGGVQRAGETVRINLQLVDAESDEHLWAETYDRPLTVENLLGVQSEVAVQVAEALKATLTPDDTKRIRTRSTEILEAYDYYLRGKDYYRRSYSLSDLRAAAAMYETAVTIDTTFAAGLAELSKVHSRMYWFYFDRSDERLAQARKSATRALRFEPTLPAAHLALGYYYYVSDRDYEAALREYTAALKEQPDDLDILDSVASVLRRRGQWDRSAETFERAAELDPRSNLIFRELGNTYLRMRLYPEAEARFRRAVSLAPDLYISYLRLAGLYLASQGDSTKARLVLEDAWRQINNRPLFSEAEPWGWWVYRNLTRDYQATLERLLVGSPGTDTASHFLTKAELYELMNDLPRARATYDSAMAVLEQKVILRPESARYRVLLALAYAGLGRNEDAVREGQLAVELLPPSRDSYTGPDWIAYLALIYAKVGEHDAAIEQLEYLLSVPAFMSVSWLRLDPAWDPLRDHPRFQALLEKYE
jgi:TolB-like protein/Tfp pilus assembly protein PilF